MFLEAMMKTCPDCGVEPGQQHKGCCDVEICSACGDQFISCDCQEHDPAKSVWTGLWPGVAECRERGWYIQMSPGPEYKIGPACDKSHPWATEDINRWFVFSQTGEDPGPNCNGAP